MSQWKLPPKREDFVELLVGDTFSSKANRARNWVLRLLIVSPALHQLAALHSHSSVKWPQVPSKKRPYYPSVFQLPQCFRRIDSTLVMRTNIH